MDVHGIAADCVEPGVKANVAVAAGKENVLGIRTGVINDDVLPVATGGGKVLIQIHTVYYDISACCIGCREQTAVCAVVGSNADNQILITGNVYVGFDQEAASAVRSCGQLCCVCCCIVLSAQTVKTDHAAHGICAVEQNFNRIKLRLGLRLGLCIRFGFRIRLCVGFGIRLGILLLIKTNICACTLQRAEECNGIEIHNSAVLSIQPRIKADICTVATVQRIRAIFNAILCVAIIEHYRDPFVHSGVLDVLVGINATGYDIMVRATACHKEHAVAASETGFNANCYVRIFRNFGNGIKVNQEIGSAVCGGGDLHS